MRKIVFFFFLLNVLSFADNVVWKSAESFRNMQNNLQELMRTYGANENLSALWESSARLAKMHDRCSSISLNDVLDEDCSHFYKVELPEFERKFQRVSGEIRMNALSIQSNVDDQLNKLKACASALEVFYVAESQLKTFDGELGKIKPMDLSGISYEVSYSFKIGYDESVMKSLDRMARLWAEQCADVVVENENLFETLVEQLNVEAALHKGLRASLQLFNDKLSFYFKRNAGGYFEFGNARVCSIGGSVLDRYLIIDLNKNGNNWIETSRGVNTCDGKMSLKKNENLWGRWVWNPETTNCSAIFFRGSKDYWDCMRLKNQK